MAFIFGITVSIIYLSLNKSNKSLVKNNTYAGIILFVISLMQLNEFLLWRNPKSYLYNMLIMLTLFIQLSAYYVVLHEEIYSLILYIIISLITLFILFVSKKSFDASSTCNFGCRLNWDVITKFKQKYLPLYFLYGVIYIIMSLMVVYNVFSIEVFISFTVLSLLCYIYDWYKNGFGRFTFGSFWCFMCVALSFVLLKDAF